MTPGPPRPAVAALDHLLLGVPDLEAGVKWFEERSGVRAVAGGRHPGAGTRNALLSLSVPRYLEILAPDPLQPSVRSRLADLLGVREPRLVQWAASSTDLDGLIGRARTAGVEIGDATAGSRTRPDGRVLRWRTAVVGGAFAAGSGATVPFFIEWSDASAGSSGHPSAESPAGCSLEALELSHPEPGRLRRLLADLGIASDVRAGGAPLLRATLRTPRGRLILE